MKKSILIIFTSMLLLCSCTANTVDHSQAQSTSEESVFISDPVSTLSVYDLEQISNIYVTHNSEGRYLSDLYEYPIKTAFYSGEWIDSTAECLHDFTIKLDGKLFYYHSECGTLQLNGKSKHLNNSDKANVNELLFALFELE